MGEMVGVVETELFSAYLGLGKNLPARARVIMVWVGARGRAGGSDGPGFGEGLAVVDTHV